MKPENGFNLCGFKRYKHTLIDDAYLKNGNLKGTLDEGIKISENENLVRLSQKTFIRRKY
jgi:hypothetical protein